MPLHDTQALDPVTQEIARPAIPILPLEPKRIPRQGNRRGFFPRTWKDAMYASIGLFFVSLSVPFLVLAWRLWGGHL